MTAFPFLFALMNSEQQRLARLGWRALDAGRQEDGRYCVLAKSCGHLVISLADTREDAWLGACALAMKVTEGKEAGGRTG